MNMHKSERLREACDALYLKLLDAGFEVLFDDRKVRPGFMFSDMELIGIPHRVVVSDRGLDSETLEYRGRGDNESQDIAIKKLIEFLNQNT